MTSPFTDAQLTAITNNAEAAFECSDDEIMALCRELLQLRQQITLLKRAARLIHKRRDMVSGSYEMAECDDVCKEAGLDVWTWPIFARREGK